MFFVIIALAGNQNCGKTTLFNKLTGARRKVGNWPGVTVEKVTGTLQARWISKQAAPVQIVDLPGVYSLIPFSPEEQVACGFLRSEPPDAIVNVVDAAHLERNLYLTLQLLELGIPVVLALNMMDELKARGGLLDTKRLAELLGVPVVPVCARNGEGLPALMQCTAETVRQRRIPPKRFCCSGEAERMPEDVLRKQQMSGRQPYALHRSVAAHMDNRGHVRRSRLLSAKDEPEKLRNAVTDSLRTPEAEGGLSPSAALTAERYCCIDRVLAGCLKKKPPLMHTKRLDKLLLSSAWALPALMAVMGSLLGLSFGFPGRVLTDLFAGLLEAGADELLRWLSSSGVAAGLISLIEDVFLRGVFSVLSFLPSLLLLLFLLNLLEDSGYLARAAVLMDRPMRCAGLSGLSLIPFITGFGCTVPAVLGARTLKGKRQRILTVLLTPLMSCSAKIPVYAMICNAFFPARQMLVMVLLYSLGILLAALAGCFARRALRRDDPEENFVLELPDYRFPSLKNALLDALEKTRDFAARTFSVILMASLVIWLLNGYTFALRPAIGLNDSMLGVLSGWLAPLLRPCGFGRSEAVAALLTGLLAKESIISTLAVLSVPSGAPAALSGLGAVFPDSRSALAFLVFVLLYPPCAAAMSAIRREVNSTRLAAAAFLGQLLLAWILSATIYQLSGLL